MGGPPPIPTKLKMLHGNPGKRALNKNEPQPDVEMPEMPDFLSSEARDEWEFIAHRLKDLGVLSKIDHAALEAYCIAYGRWRRVESLLNEGNLIIKSSSGDDIVNPLIWVANKSMHQMRQLLAEFGMTPSSRNKIVVSDKKKNTNEYEKWKARTKTKEA